MSSTSISRSQPAFTLQKQTEKHESEEEGFIPQQKLNINDFGQNFQSKNLRRDDRHSPKTVPKTFSPLLVFPSTKANSVVVLQLAG